MKLWQAFAAATAAIGIAAGAAMVVNVKNAPPGNPQERFEWHMKRLYSYHTNGGNYRIVLDCTAASPKGGIEVRERNGMDWKYQQRSNDGYLTHADFFVNGIYYECSQDNGFRRQFAHDSNCKDISDSVTCCKYTPAEIEASENLTKNAIPIIERTMLSNIYPHIENVVINATFLGTRNMNGYDCDMFELPYMEFDSSGNFKFSDPKDEICLSTKNSWPVYPIPIYPSSEGCKFDEFSSNPHAIKPPESISDIE